MSLSLKPELRAAAVAVLLLNAALAVAADTAPPLPANAQETTDGIAREIEQIRGLKFKQPVRVEAQSVDEFGKFVSRELDEEVPQSIRDHYGMIVSTLGLYRGPPIEDFSALMTRVMTSQVGAYYDPEKRSFFVVMTGLPDMMQGVIYSHELYHALQDQYFDLTRYMEPESKDPRNAATHNSDSRMARTAVVEGEATYMMSLWMMQKVTQKAPTHESMASIVAMQANMSMDQLREAMKQPQVAEMVGKEMQGTVDAAREIPSFIMDSMLGVYFKGLSFVYAVHEKG